jgi:hypothetical protein
MRQVLWKYLALFKKLYPTHPSPETWDVYERALADVNDVDLTGACEICIRELTYFPMAAEIRNRVNLPDKFQGTSSFDIGTDFVPLKDWYESHTKTHNLHVQMDRYGRTKVQQVLASPEHKLITWPQHWPEKNCQPMTWDQARKKIAVLVKKKAL